MNISNQSVSEKQFWFGKCLALEMNNTSFTKKQLTCSRFRFIHSVRRYILMQLPERTGINDLTGPSITI